jgi:hypothetical protein
VPAHNEESTIAACLVSVARAARQAIQTEAFDRVHVAVVAHRCTDRTLEVAHRLLTQHDHWLSGFDVVAFDHRTDVGAVRALAVQIGLRRLGGGGDAAWIYSTDADTHVGSDWLVRGLEEATQNHAVGLAGLVELDAWRGSDEARARYERIVADGLILDFLGRPSHEHVYGANLLVRADAYRAVGGFPPSGHGEDRRLVEALIAAGHPFRHTRRWSVTTSGRMLGRARDGLADLLRDLDTADPRPSGNNGECEPTLLRSGDTGQPRRSTGRRHHADSWPRTPR